MAEKDHDSSWQNGEVDPALPRADHRRLVRAAVEQVARLRSETSALRDIQAQLAAQERALQERCEAARREQVQLQARLQDKESRIRQIGDETAELDQETAAVQEHLTRTTERLRSTSQRNEALQRQLVAATDQIATAREALASGQEAIRRLHRRMAKGQSA